LSDEVYVTTEAGGWVYLCTVIPGLRGMSMLKNIWHDPVWSKLIAEAIKYSILGVVSLGVLSYFAGWWSSIAQGTLFIVQWIVSEYRVPNWLILISSVLVVWKVVDIGHVIRTIFKERNKIGNEIHNDLVHITSQTSTPVRKWGVQKRR
jgi:hypothetical protein